MKNSNIEWIGEIPEDWCIAKYKYFSKSRMGETILINDTIENGIPVYSSTQDDKFLGCVETAKVVLHYNDIVIPARGNSIGFAKIVREDRATCTQTTICSTNVHNVEPNFLYYCCHGLKEYWFQYDGSAIPQITVSQVENNSLALPPIETQKAIVDFLDKKCSEIDGLMSDIQSQIDILEEYKKSIITEAVTKGLNPDVETKDSGIEWIGMIPEHWAVDKGKYFLRYLQKPVKETDDVITCFRDGEVTLRTNRREDGFTISLKEIGYQGIDVGDLVVHGMDGFAGAIGISDSRGKSSPVLNVLDADHNKRYLMYYLRNMAYNGVFIAIATGIRVRTCDTGWNKLRELPYTLPPKNEQDEIADFIDTKCAEVDAVITDKKAQLETLAEYKKSLIYEYVTGRKEVLNAKISF